MRKNILALLISFCIYGCSSIELESASSSEEHAKRILSLGLSHEENLVEANKLRGNHLISVVTLQLVNARDEKIQAENDIIEAEKFAELVEVSQNGLNFMGAKIVETKETFFSSGINQQNYHLIGLRDPSSGVITHKLNLTLEHNSENIRNYTSANLCDKWARCDSEMREINQVSAIASNCAADSCKYKEVVELKLSDDFLKKHIDTGFSMRFYSKDESNKVRISKSYLMGYLSVTN